jgi:glyoxylase-like metal-dependent hydrolase (beta-lactamase superfamily II)
VLIDPGDEVGALLDAAAADRATVTAILLTHAHLDHITGVTQAKSATGAPVWMHRDDLFLYDGVVEQGRMFGLNVSPQPAIDRFYEPARQFEFGHCVVDVITRPGIARWRLLAIGENNWNAGICSLETRCLPDPSAGPICRVATWRPCWRR